MNVSVKILSRHIFCWGAVLCVGAVLLASCSQSSAGNASNSDAIVPDSQAPANSSSSTTTNEADQTNEDDQANEDDQPNEDDQANEGEPENTGPANSNAESTTTDPTTSSTLDLEELSNQPDDDQLQSLEARLSAEFLTLDEIASIWLPHMEWAISIEILGETATAIASAMDVIDEALDELNAPETSNTISFNQDETFISASAAKPFWMVAVAAELGTEAIAAFAHDVLCESDNAQTSEVIKLIGIDRINEFLHSRAGLTDTFLLAWTFGEEPPEPASQEWTSQTRYTSNRTTVTDAVNFYSQLYYGELLNPQETEVMLGWLADFSRCKNELAQPLLLRLPQETQVLHKAGWLPPMCCISETATLNDFGIVSAAGATYSLP